MKEHRRRVTIDVRDPVQLMLYEQFVQARAEWGDKGQKLDIPLIQALQEQARMREEVQRQQRELRRQEQAAVEARGRGQRNEILAQRYREQDARNRLIPEPNPNHFNSYADYNRAIEQWRVMARQADVRQLPDGVYPAGINPEQEFANRRINMRNAVNMERERQNEIARARYNAMARGELVEQGDAAVRDLLNPAGRPLTPIEIAERRARDWAERHNAARPPLRGIAQEAHDFFYRPEPPGALADGEWAGPPTPPEEPAHMQEFDEVE